MNNRWRMGMRAGLMLPPVQYGGLMSLDGAEIEEAQGINFDNIKLYIDEARLMRRKWAMRKVELMTMREDKRKVRPWQL